MRRWKRLSWWVALHSPILGYIAGSEQSPVPGPVAAALAVIVLAVAFDIGGHEERGQ